MAKFTATIEQAGDGSWTAALFGNKDIVLGTGDTRDEALDDLRKGLVALIGYLKEKGESLLQSSVEVVSIEVEA
jgi:predicted RNase H-like HicB family nuclease